MSGYTPCRGFRVVPPGSGQQARRIQRLVDFLVEETLATSDAEILAGASPEQTLAAEQELRAEIDAAIAKATGQ